MRRLAALVFCTFPLLAVAAEPAAPVAVPVAQQQQALARLKQAGRDHGARSEAFFSRRGILTENATWQPATCELRLPTAGGEVLAVQALPVARLAQGQWHWPQAARAVEPAGKLKAWLQENGLGPLAERPSLPLGPEEVRSLLGMAAELTQEDAFLLLPQAGQGWQALVFSTAAVEAQAPDMGEEAAAEFNRIRCPLSQAPVAEASDAQIIAWLAQDDTVELQERFPIRLADGEAALLVNVYFPDRGRNFSVDVALVRPAQAGARFLERNRVTRVVDLGADFATGVVLETGAGGQGAFAGSHFLSYVEGWQVVDIHEGQWASDSGGCTMGRRPWRCTDITVDWSFQPQDGAVLLVEKVTTAQGPHPDRMKTTRSTKRYLVRGKSIRLLPAAPASAPPAKRSAPKTPARICEGLFCRPAEGR